MTVATFSYTWAVSSTTYECALECPPIRTNNKKRKTSAAESCKINLRIYDFDLRKEYIPIDLFDPLILGENIHPSRVEAQIKLLTAVTVCI